MGIHQFRILYTLCDQSIPDIQRAELLKDLAGYTLVVDTNLHFFKIVCASIDNTYTYINQEGQVVSHLFGFATMIKTALSCNISLIFVLDGVGDSDLKDNTKLERAKKKAIAKEHLATLQPTDPAYISKLKQTMSMEPSQAQDLMTLLDLMGMPNIRALGEADPLCVWLTKRKWRNPNNYTKSQHNTTLKNYARFVLSEDSDMLALGASYEIKGTLSNPVIVNRKRLLEALGITNQQFLLMTTLMGNDYCKNIYNFAGTKIYKLLKDHPNFTTVNHVIEHLQANEPYEITPKQIQDFTASLDYFANAIKSLDKYMQDSPLDESKLKMTLMNYDDALAYLIKKDTKKSISQQRYINTLTQIYNCQVTMLGLDVPKKAFVFDDSSNSNNDNEFSEYVDI
ncbi:XPG family DNA repair endonuclease [uncultured virus]|nr:XPG family DNA repair endonuclease [uncultured virus]